MSAGNFVSSRYQVSYGLGTNIHPIKVQPETLQASFGASTPVVNEPPPGASNNPITAVVSRGKRSRGLNARRVTFRFTGTPPTGYLPGGILTIPWLRPIPVEFIEGTPGTYLGQAVELISVLPEVAR